MARIGDLLAAGRTFSFEFSPPKTTAGSMSLGRTIAELESLSPSFVSCTYGAGGSTRDRTLETVLEIKNELCYHYSTIDFGTNQKDTIQITPTDTLISKIMLGTLGCTPAYDTYTQKILSRKENTTKNFNHRSLEHFFQFAQKNHSGHAPGFLRNESF